MPERSQVHYTYDGSGWLECFADDPGAEHGLTIGAVEPGDNWDVLADRVAVHQAEHGCAMSALPVWDDLSDLDKGAVLLHLHKREWEGPEYAESDYPCRYFDHPALTALTPQQACAHAVSLSGQAEALDDGEHERLYDAGLDADRARPEHASAGHAIHNGPCFGDCLSGGAS